MEGVLWGGAKFACISTLEGPKAVFSYVNLQVCDSAVGAKAGKIFHLGALSPRSLQIGA